jgi:hypothetical protein
MAQSRVIAGSLKRLRDTLRPPVFSPPPLKFRTAGFPQYGFKRKLRGDLRRTTGFDLYATKVRDIRAAVTGPRGAGITRCGPRRTRTIPSRGPWLASRLCCPAGSRLTMASSEPLASIRRLIFFARRIPRLRVGPQFKRLICSCMPSLGPRWTDRMPTVARPTALVFAILPEARQPHSPRTLVLTWAVSRGWIGFTFATACTITHPSPTRAFPIELSPAGSPQADVDHVYTANSQFRDRSCTGKMNSRMGCKGENRGNKGSVVSSSLFLVSVPGLCLLRLLLLNPFYFRDPQNASRLAPAPASQV